MNKQLGYLIFACLVTVGGFTLIGMRAVNAEAVLPIIGAVIGHYYGTQSKDAGKSNGKSDSDSG